jgi:hypothetical protein
MLGKLYNPWNYPLLLAQKQKKTPPDSNIIFHTNFHAAISKQAAINKGIF